MIADRREDRKPEANSPAAHSAEGPSPAAHSAEGPRPAAPLLVVLHGVNLDLLGERSAEHYGSLTLAQLEDAICEEAQGHGWRCACRQTNHEGAFVEYLHQHRRADALLVNPGAWTHYSYAIRDALELVKAPTAEVHLSDISSREEWRRRSVISDVVSFSIMGRGVEGYREAVRRLVTLVGTGREGEGHGRAS